MASEGGSVPFKIIVGIDYGTTYSGISWVTTNKTSDDIVIVTRWPEHRDQSWKTPSVISFAKENPKQKGRNYWGYEVGQNAKQYAWTKLLLDKNVNLVEHDDQLLRKMYGEEGFLGLPADMTAKDVVRDYLAQLYEYTVTVLVRELGQAVFDSLPMDCWITMPAIWSDGAQSATREAALQGGFGSRAGDTVSMITEPEAAALWALKPYLAETSLARLEPGEHVLICDCGGGTVDLVCYEILAIEPFLKHREKCTGSGAKCGATTIDRHFVKWMETTFGEAYTSLSTKKRGPGSAFMQSFESQKRNFGDRDDDREIYTISSISMKLEEESDKYDDDDNEVKVTKEEMKSFFEPAVNDLLAKVKEQKDELARKNCKIDRLVLVGGFGDSPLLNNRLRTWCRQNDVQRFTCPTDCQAAIVKGAALRGLEGIRPTIIIAKRHYGWSWHMKFRPGIDDEKHSFVLDFDNTKRCRGRLNWAVSKGQELDETFTAKTRVVYTMRKGESAISTLELFSCPLDEAPEHVEKVGVRREGVITTRFSTSDATRTRHNDRLNSTVYQFDYDVEVSFRSSEGILGFQSFIGASQAGTTSIAFDK